MEDDRTKNRVMPLLFVGLLLLSFMNGVHADESTNEFVVDGRLQMVNLQPGQDYQQSLSFPRLTLFMHFRVKVCMMGKPTVQHGCIYFTSC